jgi:hypothetical protein
MPEPTSEELRSDDQDGYMSRCIPYVKNEDPGLSHDAVVARCFGMWRQAKERKSE